MSEPSRPAVDLPSSAVSMRTSNHAALWAVIRPLLRKYQLRMFVALILVPVSMVMALGVPYLTKLAIDEVIVPAAAAHSLEPYYRHLITLIIVAICAVLLGYLSDSFYVAIVQRTGQSLIADMRARLYQRTLLLPRAYYDTHPIGTLLTRVTSDMEALGETLATGVLSMFADVLKATAILVMMFALNWRLTLVLLAVIPAVAILIQFFQARIRSTFFVSRQALSEATGYLQECLAGMKTLQLFGAEKKALAAFTARNRRFVDAQNSSNTYDAIMFSLVEGVTTLSLALVLWYAAGGLLAGTLTLGVLVAFMEYIQRIFVPLREFSQQVAVLQRGMAALDHVGEMLRVPLDPAEPEAAPERSAGTMATDHAPPPASLPLAGGDSGHGERFESLVFDGVRFRYKADGPEIVSNVSFSLRRGETLAIVGATGSGKSTLIKLLTRAYGGYEGSIRLNGIELRDLTADRLARLISVVHQGVFLYQGSVGFNIGLGRDGLGQADIERAAAYVNADRFIGQLEGAYTFRIAPGGANLSAGQCQLISFARAVAAQTELIVLDEATSSIDSMTEKLIQEAVGRLYEDKTVIAIAHRLSTIRSADTILVMEQGHIAESGTHEQLVAAGGVYAGLVGSFESTDLQAGGRDSRGPQAPA